MGKNKRELIHRNGGDVFPWRWLMFLIGCLFFGGEGIMFFIVVFALVKGFTKTMNW